MSKKDKSINSIFAALKERAKELNCLYQVEELTSNYELSLDDVCKGVIDVIPQGWQYLDICQVKITILNSSYQLPGFKETQWMQNADIVLQDEVVGSIKVYYTHERPVADEGPFLTEERKLINTIAELFSHRIMHQKLKDVFDDQKGQIIEDKRNWGTIFDLLRKTDSNLLMLISRKLLNYLCWNGIKEAEQLLEQYSPFYKNEERELLKGINSPFSVKGTEDFMTISEDVFKIASKHLSEKEILSNIQKWVQEDKTGFLVSILENPGASLAEIISAIERYHHLKNKGLGLSHTREKGFRVSLTRRLLTDQPQFIKIAENYIGMESFYKLFNRIIFSSGGYGKLGGKSSGVILATEILKKSSAENKFLQDIKTPKTWFITSDCILNFLSYNNLEDIVEQKYKDIGQIRQEYPYIVYIFKKSPLPPEIVKGLKLALDDFGDTPLIVRSSSQLEDRKGSSFAGKYKSLFIANQGTKEERLIALIEAITEVYASTFAADPIEYRIKRDLLDFHEEMGIMIQTVVGKKVGHYYFPAFAGVAFSNNEFPWSARIKREDGLIRMVPGLGTRAVDRVSDDYPILIAPGQPGISVNITSDEKIRYSPRKIDVINLKTNTFETLEIQDLLKEIGPSYPALNQLFSIVNEDYFQQPTRLGVDFEKDHLISTFEGLLKKTTFIEKMNNILNVLKDKFGSHVDIEFACDGTDFYLLQCRPQNYGVDCKPALIPADIPNKNIIFSADRFISNATVSDITHIVYIDPQKYSEINTRTDLLEVGRAVGELNQILPKRQFILMGPGRWGSRGDIKLGVNVTYSDINNTSMLIEIARKHKGYVPDLSFGTHFFQDLLEDSIRYLPLYPDELGNIFNEKFLLDSENLLVNILPEFDFLSDIVRVIDVSGSTEGLSFQVLMNADIEKAVGVLVEHSEMGEINENENKVIDSSEKINSHWRWRMRNVERLASQIDQKRFGVKAFYIFGSTKNRTARPDSDIDILIHFQGTNEQKKGLLTWLEGWSLCLSQINFFRTGQKTDGLLDIHLITDEDIKNQTSFARKISTLTDAARPLSLGKPKST